MPVEMHETPPESSPRLAANDMGVIQAFLSGLAVVARKRGKVLPVAGEGYTDADLEAMAERAGQVVAHFEAASDKRKAKAKTKEKAKGKRKVEAVLVGLTPEDREFYDSLAPV